MIGIKCDGCNKMHATDLLTMRYADSLPDDLKCLNSWLAPQTGQEPHALDHVKECVDVLHTSICCMSPQEAATGPSGVFSQMQVVENVKEDYNKLRDAVKALGMGPK